jgi:methionine biosynthesis protein MetW
MSAGSTRYRADFQANGFSGTHKKAISWVAPGSRVLEVGCSSGYLGRALIDKGCHVTGLEIDPEAAREARENGLIVKEGSVEDASFRASIAERYDFVLATDVLEHLREPAPVLENFKRWLGPGGQAIISVPNIASWSMREQLFFRGDFEYQETGILDRTHVHFFTWETLHKLLDRQEWTIAETMVAEWQLPVLSTALVKWPGNVRAFWDKKRAQSDGVVASVQGGMSFLARRLQRGGSLAISALGKNWPNLSASHIAMLLRPPTEH